LIIEVIAGNEDAQVVLVDLEVKGKKLDEGLKLIVKESYDLGFIKGNKSVVLGIEKEENKQQLMNHLNQELSKMKALNLKVYHDFKQGMSEVLDNLKQEADSHEMTLAKYRMALRLKTIDSEVTFESLKDVDMKEIIHAINEHVWLLHPKGVLLQPRFEGYRDYLNRNLLRKARIVDTLGRLILKANPDYFNDYLGESEVKAEQLVDLYHEYLLKLQSVIILSVDQDYQALINQIKADSEFILLETQLNEAINDYKALFVVSELDKEDVLIKLEALLEVMKDLHVKINARINVLIDDEALIGIYHHGRIIIRPIRPITHPYVVIREEYAQYFDKLGFSIDTYEAYVLKILSANTIYASIKAELDSLINELSDELAALKQLRIEYESDLNVELQQRNLYLKSQMRIRGNN
ncbi:MAG: hypothetical protein WC939_05745, partial [Acholeplasmataceae bacterium]